ncbi:MAG: hypothetical protein AB7N80_10445 [Bdellovibrionales bacterium]
MHSLLERTAKRLHAKWHQLPMALVISLALLLINTALALKVFFALTLIVLFPAHRLVIIGFVALFGLSYDMHFVGGDARTSFLNELNQPTAVLMGSFLSLFFLLGVRALIHPSLNQRAWTFTGMAWVTGFYLICVQALAQAKETIEIFPWVYALQASFLISLTKFIWYFAYDLQRNPNQQPFKWIQHLAYYRPFWSFFFYAPIPKGENYWHQIEIQDPHQLAIQRVKAVTLVLWATVLEFTRLQLNQFLQQIADSKPDKEFVYSIQQSLAQLSQPQPLSISQAWTSVLIDFADNLLLFTAYGHFIIGLVWFIGYRAPLNTNRPLTAKTPLDFFQRYNFYFKELLFQFFFFPVFARLNRLPDKWRIAVSLFVAVGIGNFLIIWGRNTDTHLKMGLPQSLSHFSNYAVYCVLLTLLLLPSTLASMARAKHKSRPALGCVNVALTILAFAVIRIFDEQFAGLFKYNIALLKILFGMAS